MIDIFKKNELEVVENTPEDILSVVKEAEARITNHWKETEEEMHFQKQFWERFPCNLKEQSGNRVYAEKINIKIGSHFLKKNAALFD